MNYFEFTSHMLYLFVAFMCGVYLGYLVGLKNGE